MDANVALVPFLTKYGINTISYPALNSDLNQWVDQNNGCASYASHLGYNFILGRPLCSMRQWPLVVSKLVKDLRSPAFVQIGEPFAKFLHDEFDYKITKIGVERFLNIQDYSLDNCPKKSRLRASVRKGLAEARFHELTQAQLESNFNVRSKELEFFSANWLQRKALKKPLRLLIRKPTYKDEPFVRKFYSFDKNNDLLGFVFFSPIFENNQVIGYCTDTMRASQNAPYGHVAFMIMQAMDKFKGEGKNILSLGLAPEAHFFKSQFRHDFLTHQSLKFLYRNTNNYFNFLGIYNYKKQFGGITKPSYVATRRRFSLFESYSLLRYMNFL